MKITVLLPMAAVSLVVALAIPTQIFAQDQTTQAQADLQKHRDTITDPGSVCAAPGQPLHIANNGLISGAAAANGGDSPRQPALPSLQAEPHCPGNIASLRLRLVQRSQIIVPVTINHSGPYDFLVDTGAQVSTVDLALAGELHLKIEGTTELVGVGFRTRPSFAHLDILEVGSHALANSLVVVRNLEHLQAVDPHIRGILGGNFLGHFDVLIDYAHNMLCLDDAKIMEPEIKGKHIALVTPPHPEDTVLFTEPLIIPVHLGGTATRQLLLLLDSGANVPFLYDSGKDMAGGFSVSAPIRDRGPDGVERVFSVLPPQDIQMDTLTFHQISFVTPTATRKDVPRVEVDGLLPTALFRRVYISYADRFVILEPR